MFYRDLYSLLHDQPYETLLSHLKAVNPEFTGSTEQKRMISQFLISQLQSELAYYKSQLDDGLLTEHLTLMP